MVPVCPECQSVLAFAGSWTFRDLWGYTEVQTYECRTHGPIFVTPETSRRLGPHKGPDRRPDDSDRDSLTPVRRKPRPPLDADAIALPEPDSH